MSGIAMPQASGYVKEMRKFEQRAVQIGDTFITPIPMEDGGKMNFPHHEYPKMLYRAERADGGPRIAGSLIVHSAREEQAMCAQGWCDGQNEAIEAITAQDREFAELAANRHHHERRMSPTARAAADEVDEASIQHVPEIPATPIKPRKPSQPPSHKARTPAPAGE